MKQPEVTKCPTAWAYGYVPSWNVERVKEQESEEEEHPTLWWDDLTPAQKKQAFNGYFPKRKRPSRQGTESNAETARSSQITPRED